MGFMPAWGSLAPWGQAAAIVILLYVFASIIMGVVLTAVMMFLFAWLREKAELIKKLRPAVDQVNEAMLASQRDEPLPPQIADNKLVQVVAQVPKLADSTLTRVSSIEQKVDYGSTRVADAVIEFRARTEMVKGMARAFFLPGLTKRRAIAPVAQLASEQVAAPEEQPMEQEIIIRQSFSSTRS